MIVHSLEQEASVALPSAKPVRHDCDLLNDSVTAFRIQPAILFLEPLIRRRSLYSQTGPLALDLLLVPYIAASCRRSAPFNCHDSD